MCVSCDYPNEMECVDNRCVLTMGCKYLEKCMNTLSNEIYKGMTCICNYKENGLLVYQLPECVIMTDSPTVSPTNSPTNSSVVGSDIQEAAKDNIDDYIAFYILGGVAVVVMILLYFRNKVISCFNCNKVDDDSDSE